MLKTIVVDDERAGRDLLKVMLDKCCPQVEVIADADSVQQAIALITQHKPDLVFLDIELSDGTGFDVLQGIPDHQFAVIFVTAYDKYASKAFKYSALDYLLKPVDEDELIEAVKKAQSGRSDLDLKQKITQFLEQYKPVNPQQSSGKLGISSLDGYEFIDIATIVRCEADGKYTTCYLTEGQRIVSSRSIKEFEEQLSASNFFRVHHSHLINLKFIRKYHKGRGGYVIMNDESSVPVAERKKDEFLNCLQRI
ncbi:MAG: LytTR family DNA-binding domain-containing protein [Bacteroidota bacterium]